MPASKIDLTPGNTRPASTGRKSIQVDSLGDLVLVDDLGVVSPIGGSGGVSDHPSLTDRNLANQHTIGAITGLADAIDDNTQLADSKENMLGNPVSNGMHLASDVAGNRSWVSPPTIITDHPSLSDRNVADQHTIGAITGLQSELNSKQNNLPVPLITGLHLTSDLAGNVSWDAPPVQEKSHIFSARNEIWQSFDSQSEIVTEWNVETLKHAKFVHDNVTNPEAITINHTGFIQVWCKMNFEINESNRILFRTNISLDWGWLPETIAYAYARHRSYVDVATIPITGIILPVVSGQILRVHNQIAYNDDASGLGDQESVNTVWGESSITIATVVEP